MDLPPWNDHNGTRIWPNVIPLPAGYPAPYIALMMDRVNFPVMPNPNWTYGAHTNFANLERVGEVAYARQPNQPFHHPKKLPKL